MGRNSQRRRRRAEERQRPTPAPSNGHAFAGGGSGPRDSARTTDAAGGAPGRSSTGTRPGAPETPRLDDMVTEAAGQAILHLARGDGLAFHHSVRRLAEGPGVADVAAWRRLVARRLSFMLTNTITSAWRNGWEPADLTRIAAREFPATHQALVRAAMAAEIATYAAATVDARWLAQLAAAEAVVWWPPDQPFLKAVLRGSDHPRVWATVVTAAFEVSDHVSRLPRLEPLSPLPGTATPSPDHDPHHAVDERILAKVRALLAKAESTPYPAEAETFTAGAQAMMARHSIDRALLEATARRPRNTPGGRRIGVDNPYEGPKAMLLDAVANANRCRSVWSKAFGFSTVIGFREDLDAVELLFTSLLIQATTAMTRAGSKQDAIGRSRTRSFRQSFLVSYAGRIRERLSEATTAQTDAAASEVGGTNLLPVLAARAEAVDEAVAEMFPHLSQSSVGRTWDREGWASGRAAADLASLHAAQALPN